MTIQTPDRLEILSKAYRGSKAGTIIIMQKGTKMASYNTMTSLCVDCCFPYQKLSRMKLPFVYKGILFTKINHRTPNGMDKMDYQNISDFDSDTLIAKICFLYQITGKDIQSGTRKRAVVNARILISIVLLVKTDITLKAVANHFGHNDHATILHYVKKFTDLIKVDEDYLDEVEPVLDLYKITMTDILGLSNRKNRNK